MSTDTALTFTNDPDQGRYVARMGDKIAGFVEYSQLANGLLLSHTEVDPAFEGHGVGSGLARHVLGDARAQGEMVIPACQFIAGYIRKHPEYLDLVSEASRAAFKL